MDVQALLLQIHFHRHEVRLFARLGTVLVFVSQAWNGPGKRKMKMLREFLILQSFVGSATVLLIVIAAVITPIGFSFAEPVYIDLGILQR